MKEKKAVAIFAKYGGENVEADIDINNERLDNCKTPYTVNLPYGMHDISVSYMGRSNSKRFKVGDRTSSICSIELPDGVTKAKRSKELHTADSSLGQKHYWNNVDRKWVRGVSAAAVYKNLLEFNTMGCQVGIRARTNFGKSKLGLYTGAFYEYSTGINIGMGEAEQHALYVPAHLNWRAGKTFNLSAGIGFNYDELSFMSYSGSDYYCGQLSLLGEVGCNVQLKKFLLEFQCSYGRNVVVIEGDGGNLLKFSLGLSYAF